MKIIFLERGGQAIFRRISKKSKLNISLDLQPKVLNSLFLCYVQIESYRNILTIRCRPLAFTSYKTFLKIKKRSGTGLTACLSFDFFLKKNFCHITFY